MVIMLAPHFSKFVYTKCSCFVRYEDEFLQETYFYHVIRKDHRHNFSVWFYNIYLTFESNEAHILGLLTFFPQLFLVLASGFAFGKDIFFACFIQTFLFVTFNKVCTSQVSFQITIVKNWPSTLLNTLINPIYGMALAYTVLYVVSLFIPTCSTVY